MNDRDLLNSSAPLRDLLDSSAPLMFGHSRAKQTRTRDEWSEIYDVSGKKYTTDNIR